MMCGDHDHDWIWQTADWPHWRYDLERLTNAIAETSHAQGRLHGRLAGLGLAQRDHASLLSLTDDVVKTSAIEGEQLDVTSVRSSIARRLGVDIGALAPIDRRVEGVVDMVMDATNHALEPLTVSRLFGWHAALFPGGYSGLQRLAVGRWRDDRGGPMEVVSGPAGRERVHFRAPPAESLPDQMKRFLSWIETDTVDAPLIKAGLGHFWFVTVHPFDDGNGRIARAIGDLLLTRADRSPQRFYSLSAQIQRERSGYYRILEQTQRGSMDVTAWLLWFLANLLAAIEQADQRLDAVLAKSRFWQSAAHLPLNERQTRVLNRLLDGFEGKMTTRKWAVIGKCSTDTALRDITALVEHGLLRRSGGGGRSTSYELVVA